MENIVLYQRVMVTHVEIRVSQRVGQLNRVFPFGNFRGKRPRGLIARFADVKVGECPLLRGTAGRFFADLLSCLLTLWGVTRRQTATSIRRISQFQAERIIQRIASDIMPVY